MTTMIVYVCVVLGLVSNATCQCNSPYETPCQSECLFSCCPIGLGCPVCKPGMCKFSSGGLIGYYCMTRCPLGYTCTSDNFCTRNRK